MINEGPGFVTLRRPAQDAREVAAALRERRTRRVYKGDQNQFWDALLANECLRRAVVDLFRRLVPLVEELPNELIGAVESLEDPRQLAYLVASTIPLPGPTRQELLEMDVLDVKLQRLVELLQHELAVRELGQKITTETRERMTKAQREYFLREQLRAIRRELGEEEENGDVGQIRKRIEEAGLPEEARREADRELSRLANVPPASPEHGIIRTYLDWMASLPWSTLTGGEIDVPRARQIPRSIRSLIERAEPSISRMCTIPGW